MDINNFENYTITKLNEELRKHGHPLSRKINNKFRVKTQALKELKDHYTFYH